jgi:hypothetical protein
MGSNEKALRDCVVASGNFDSAELLRRNCGILRQAMEQIYGDVNIGLVEARQLARIALEKTD